MKSRKNERGFVLIFALAFIVIVMLVGVSSFQSSANNNKISIREKTKKMLYNEASIAMYHMQDQAVSSNYKYNFIAELTKYENSEITFCYKQIDLFTGNPYPWAIDKMAIKKWDNSSQMILVNSKSNNSGYCDPSSRDDKTNTLLSDIVANVQVVVIPSSDLAKKISNDPQEKRMAYTVYVTAFLAKLSPTNPTQKNCFSDYMFEKYIDNKTTRECLRDSNIPYVTLVSSYIDVAK